LSELQKVLFIPDTHVPYHNRLAWHTMLTAMRDWRPEHIVILGDFTDMYSVSAHEKDPRRASKLEWELEATHECLDALDNLGARWKYYVEGNHEDRWTRYLRDRCPEFAIIEGRGLHLREQLRLTERGWRWTPYKRTLKLGKLYITHDLGKAGRNAHRDAEATYQACTIIGHTHSMEYSVVGNRRNRPHVSAMFGWLGDNEMVDYRHFDKASRDWVNGFGTGRMESNGVTHVVPIPIVEGKCVVEGKLYKGKVPRQG
jgi:predicted phosphodiesterase